MQADNPKRTRASVPVVQTGTSNPAPSQDKPRKPSHDRLIKLKAVLDRAGVSRSTLYNMIEKGNFPKKIKIGRSTFWSEHAVNDWVEQQKIGGAS